MSIRVTIFEDNNRLRKGLEQLIDGSKGFKSVGSFANCNDLVEHIEGSKPDVVLMDILMPGMNGIDAVRIIKEKFPDIKILMETIFEEDEKIFASICNGAEGYILKNTPPAEILEAIREVYEGGAPMTPSIASKVLRMVKGTPSQPQPENFSLSDREKDVLKLLVEGLSYKMIADECAISAETVNNHIKNIYRKLQVHSKGEAITKAIRGKIV